MQAQRRTEHVFGGRVERPFGLTAGDGLQGLDQTVRLGAERLGVSGEDDEVRGEVVGDVASGLGCLRDAGLRHRAEPVAALIRARTTSCTSRCTRTLSVSRSTSESRNSSRNASCSPSSSRSNRPRVATEMASGARNAIVSSRSAPRGERAASRSNASPHVVATVRPEPSTSRRSSPSRWRRNRST